MGNFLYNRAALAMTMFPGMTDPERLKTGTYSAVCLWEDGLVLPPVLCLCLSLSEFCQQYPYWLRICGRIVAKWLVLQIGRPSGQFPAQVMSPGSHPHDIEVYGDWPCWNVGKTPTQRELDWEPSTSGWTGRQLGYWGIRRMGCLSPLPRRASGISRGQIFLPSIFSSKRLPLYPTNILFSHTSNEWPFSSVLYSAF